MKEYLSVLLDAFIDSVKILPILLLAYILIEFIEHKFATKLKNKHLLNKKWGPVVGGLVGSIPQCGFSVVSSDLYSRGAITVGTLIAVFIATSDEAIPIMLTNPSSYKSLLLLILFKIVIAIIVGYLTGFLYKVIFNKKSKTYIEKLESNVQANNVKIVQNGAETVVKNEDKIDTNLGAETSNIKDKNLHEHNFATQQNTEIVGVHSGCCHHEVESKKFDIWHPLFHSLKVFVFIFAISFIFGCITDIWVGEERLIKWLTYSLYTQPILCVLIGLIPNCASSVVLTELYLLGGLKFSCLLAGLMVNAGLGIIFLIKLNKNKKQNLFIISCLLISALIMGYGFIWLNI